MIRSVLLTRRRRFHAALGWTLAALVVFIGTMPPALVHTHSSWGRPGHHHALVHNPSHESSAASHHHHAHAGHHHRHSHSAAPEHEVSDAVPHMHFVWFGFELTSRIPADHRPHDDRSGQPDFFFVHLIDYSWKPGQSNGAPTHFLSPRIAPSPVETQAPLQQASFVSIPSACVLLCDTARHERSGVQLI